MTQNKTKLSFHGGAGSVTGANFLIESGKNKFLIDCGLFQGKEFCDTCNYDDFPYNPQEIDALLVTHGHTDHIGRIPRLVRHGFKGPIYSTHPTKEIAAVMYEDALSLMKMQQEEDGRELLYNESDISQALSIWKTKDYHEEIELGGDISLSFLDAGHILGSAMVEFKRGGKKLLFTGDLGNTPAPIVKDTEKIREVEYWISNKFLGLILFIEKQVMITLKEEFEKLLKGIAFGLIGRVEETPEFIVYGLNKRVCVNAYIQDLKEKGVTDDEIVAMMEFFNYVPIINKHKTEDKPN